MARPARIAAGRTCDSQSRPSSDLEFGVTNRLASPGSCTPPRGRLPKSPSGEKGASAQAPAGPTTEEAESADTEREQRPEGTPCEEDDDVRQGGPGSESDIRRAPHTLPWSICLRGTPYRFTMCGDPANSRSNTSPGSPSIAIKGGAACSKSTLCGRRASRGRDQS